MGRGGPTAPLARSWCVGWVWAGGRPHRRSPIHTSHTWPRGRPRPRGGVGGHGVNAQPTECGTSQRLLVTAQGGRGRPHRLGRGRAGPPGPGYPPRGPCPDDLLLPPHSERESQRLCCGPEVCLLLGSWGQDCSPGSPPPRNTGALDSRDTCPCKSCPFEYPPHLLPHLPGIWHGAAPRPPGPPGPCRGFQDASGQSLRRSANGSARATASGAG